MKEYFRYFKWIFIVIAVLLVILGSIKGAKAAMSGKHERTNTACTTTQRVFDKAGVLTDEEVKKLEELIAKREKQTGCDIVLVTLEESLEEYAREIEPDVPYNQFVRIYAEKFYEENHFGYNQSNGDGVILVDNWYREADGKIHTWFCTTGIVKDAYSDADIDRILDEVYLYVEDDPYRAYETYVNQFYRHMTGGGHGIELPAGLPVMAGITAAVLFFLMNWKARGGRKTTTDTTYLEGGKEHFVNRQDIFLRKSVTKRHIERSSGGSGGGGGSSSGGGGGGGSHGGGGHSR